MVAEGTYFEASCSPFVSQGVVPRRQDSSQSLPACDKKVREHPRWVWGDRRVGLMMPSYVPQNFLVVITVAARR